MADTRIFFCHRPNTTELQAEYPDRLDAVHRGNEPLPVPPAGKATRIMPPPFGYGRGTTKRAAPKKGIPDYSCKEGESL